MKEKKKMKKREKEKRQRRRRRVYRRKEGSRTGCYVRWEEELEGSKNKRKVEIERKWRKKQGWGW